MNTEVFKNKYPKIYKSTLLFKKETGKNAIIGGKLSGQFKQWRYKQKEIKQMKWNIKEIDIKNIKIDDSISFRDRWSNDENDGALLMSILDVGLITPVIIRPINNSEKYSLVEGYRRFTATKKLGREKISCKIMELSDSEAMGIFVSANLGCKELSYEQIQKQTYLFRGILNEKIEKGLLSNDEIHNLNEWVDNIERTNRPPPPMTQPYYCSWCKRTHYRGNVYKEHKGYAK